MQGRCRATRAYALAATNVEKAQAAAGTVLCERQCRCGDWPCSNEASVCLLYTSPSPRDA
eukprot:3625889-Lingulodinium_polyedra.AAC.1